MLCAALELYGRRGPGGTPWDAIVVAGAAVWPGGVASPALRRRTEHAVSLWRRGVAPKLLFTGGVGKHPPAEAEVAADIARAAGVPEEALILECRSTTTDENAAYAVLVCHAAGLGRGRVLVVTDAYHAFRCERVFRRRFTRVRAIGSVPSLRWRVKGALREVGALVIYAVQGRL